MNTSKCLEILERIKDYIPHWEEGLEALDFAIRDMDWKTHAEEYMVFGSNRRPFTMEEYKAMMNGSDVCPNCEGRKKILHYDDYVKGCVYWEEFCPDCNGTGKIEVAYPLKKKDSK